MVSRDTPSTLLWCGILNSSTTSMGQKTLLKVRIFIALCVDAGLIMLRFQVKFKLILIILMDEGNPECLWLRSLSLKDSLSTACKSAVLIHWKHGQLSRQLYYSKHFCITFLTSICKTWILTNELYNPMLKHTQMFWALKKYLWQHVTHKVENTSERFLPTTKECPVENHHYLKLRSSKIQPYQSPINPSKSP